MVSKRSDERPTGKSPPATLYLAYLASRTRSTGQRPHPTVFSCPMGVRGWTFSYSSSKGVRGQLDLPPGRSGYREERDGSWISHHLHTFAESIAMNVGGFGMNVKVSSPPMTYQSVGGVIVLGARESRVHGEGRQGTDVRRTISRRPFGEVRMSLVKLAALTKEVPMTEIREVANPWRARCRETCTAGSEGGVGKHDL